MPTYISAGQADAVAEGDAITVQHVNRIIAVFNSGGEFFATDDACPHAHGPLSQLRCDQDDCRQQPETSNHNPKQYLHPYKGIRADPYDQKPKIRP